MSRQEKKQALPAELVRRIGMLRKQCGIVDDDYYAMLSGYGAESCRDLSLEQAIRVISFLQGLPVVVPQKGGAKYDGLGFREGFATPKQLRMLEVMWRDVSFCSLPGKRGAAFREFLWNRFGLAGVENIKREDVGKIKRTLEAMDEQIRRKKKEDCRRARV